MFARRTWTARPPFRRHTIAENRRSVWRSRSPCRGRRPSTQTALTHRTAPTPPTVRTRLTARTPRTLPTPPILPTARTLPIARIPLTPPYLETVRAILAAGPAISTWPAPLSSVDRDPGVGCERGKPPKWRPGEILHRLALVLEGPGPGKDARHLPHPAGDL